MSRRIARAISAAAAAGATVAVFGLMAAGTAGAATRPAPVAYHPHAAAGTATERAPVIVTNDLAGYATALLENWKFRSVAATVPVAACQVAQSSNPMADVQLAGGAKWIADISVICNGGAGSVFYVDQKSATAQVVGTFRLTPRTGDQLRISISRNVAGHQDSFTVTNLRTRRSQTVRVTTSTAVVYHHAFLGSDVANNTDVMPLPVTTELLWTFQSSRVVTYGGVAGTVRGPWSTVRVTDRSGGTTVMFPSALSSGGANFSAFLNHA
jgi:hypothetical protein